jgi:hypothetical protein
VLSSISVYRLGREIREDGSDTTHRRWYSAAREFAADPRVPRRGGGRICQPSLSGITT